MPQKKFDYKPDKKYLSISEVKEDFCKPTVVVKDTRVAYWKKPDPLDNVKNPFANKKPS